VCVNEKEDSKCLCEETHFHNGNNQCTEKVSYDGTCDAAKTGQCAGKLQCLGSKCICGASDFHDGNNDCKTTPIVKNPQVPFEYVLPTQGLSPGAEIVLTGVPNQETEFGIYVQADHDILFLVNSRFNAAGDIRKIVLNSRINNVWGAEIRPFAFPFTIGQAYTLRIKVAKDEYLLYVDSDLINEFRASTTLARVIKVWGDTSITEFRFGKYLKLHMMPF
jgi:hypothetical protein